MHITRNLSKLNTLGNVGFAWFRHFPKRGFWNKHEHTELI
jgi:hypothetical protein